MLCRLWPQDTITRRRARRRSAEAAPRSFPLSAEGRTRTESARIFPQSHSFSKSANLATFASFDALPPSLKLTSDALRVSF